MLKSKGANFATLINPTVVIPKEMEIGEGCTITRAWFGINVKLGNCVDVHGSMIGGSTIDDFSTTTGFANIAGAQIGKRVFIGSHAVVLNKVKVGDDAFGKMLSRYGYSRVAHWKEMHDDPCSKINRPRQIYTGEVLRPWVDRKDR